MADLSELVHEWQNKAEHDLGAAEMTLVHNAAYTDIITYHCQQAAEKYLKSCLIHLGVSFHKSHSLSYLLDLVSENKPVSDLIYESAELLDDYSVEVRYPMNGPDPSVEDARRALEAARAVKEAVLQWMR